MIRALACNSIGAASAHTMVSTVAQEEPLGIDEVMTIIDEASQVIAYSHKLEEKQRERLRPLLEGGVGRRHLDLGSSNRRPLTTRSAVF